MLMPAHTSCFATSSPLDVLTEPANTLTIALSHNDTAHENLDRPNALERHLALASCLVQTKCCPELVFGNGVRVVNLVSKDDEGGIGELLHGEEGVELGFRLGKTLVVFGVDKEYNATDFRDCGILIGYICKIGWRTYSSRARDDELVRDLQDQKS